MFKVNNKDTRTTPYGVFIVNFEHISHLNFEHISQVIARRGLCKHLFSSYFANLSNMEELN